MYDFVTTNAAGCSDTITLKLAITRGTQTDTTASACNTFTWNRNGQTYAATGNYNFITTNANGCNDTITLRLTIRSSTSSSTTILLCANQVPYMWNGSSYTVTGLYTFRTLNASGCDSIATLNLVVTQSTAGARDSVSVCANTLPYIWNGLTINSAGAYSVTLINSGGCDSVVTLVLAVSPLATATITGGNPICQGGSTVLSIGLTGNAPWTLTYTDGTTPRTVSGITSSPYVVTVSPAATTTYSILSLSDLKCTNTAFNSSVTVRVLATATGIRYPNVVADVNVPRQLQARNLGSNYTYLWSPPTGLNATNIGNPIFTYDRNTQYTITLTSDSGCKVVDTLLVILRAPAAPIKSSLHVPNAWSPNSDGHNDKLFPLTINVNELYYFRVFNRWGQLMFETQRIGEGWDGIYRGKAQISDVYTWTVNAKGLDGVLYKLSGNALLLR